ncbi:MAG TPA: ATP-binding protein [Candidatus Saccharimonadales bacterium]|nr:ATP-binding protein [Candidatus Saccharimonadales bacterium]
MRTAARQWAGSAGIAGLIVAATIPFLRLAALSLAQSNADERRGVGDDRAALALSAGRTLDATIGGSFATLRAIALDPRLVDPRDPVLAKAVLLAHRRMNPVFQGIGLYDARGDDLAHTDREPRSFNVADRDYFPPVMAGRDFTGQVIVGRGTGVRTVPLAVPVVFADGTRGALVAPLALAEIEVELSRIVGRGVAVLLVDSNRQIFVHPDPEIAASMQQLNGRPDVDGALAGRAGVVTVPIDGVDSLSAFAPVPLPHWAVILRQPVSTVFAGPDARLLAGAVYLVAVLVATILIAIFLARRLTAAYAATEASGRFLEQLIESAPLAVAVTSGPTHRYVIANARYQSLAPRPPVIGRTYAEVWPADVASLGTPALDRVLMTGDGLSTIDAPVDLAVGRRYLTGVVSRHDGVAGRAPGLLAVILDTTEAVLERERAVKEKDEFLTVASHELKTPLTAISMAAQIIRRGLGRDPLDVPLLERQSATLQAQVKRSAKLIGDLLDISRLQAGRLDLEHAPVDLAALVQEVRDRQTDALPPGQSDRIGLVAEDDPMFVDGDLARLDQVVTNLVTNAVKYSPDGGPVGLRVARDGDQAVLTVADHGIGIPPAERQTLFAPFQRGASAQARRIEGTGLGLYITQRIVVEHGGELLVTETPGGGTTVTVRLPALAPPG